MKKCKKCNKKKSKRITANKTVVCFDCLKDVEFKFLNTFLTASK